MLTTSTTTTITTTVIRTTAVTMPVTITNTVTILATSNYSKPTTVRLSFYFAECLRCRKFLGNP